MSRMGGSPTDTEYWSSPGDLQNAAHAETAAAAEQFDRMVKKVNRALHRLSATDREVQAELRAVTLTLSTLTSRAQEWCTLHRLLHAVLTTMGPFRTGLWPEGNTFSPAERQVLLQNWRPCQERLDELADFVERVRAIGSPFQQDRFELRGERWAVEPIALRLLVEDTLKEDYPDPESLQEVVDDFQDACHRHIETADRGLQDSLAQLQRALAGLIGGLP
jgi:hypothetical protein